MQFTIMSVLRTCLYYSTSVLLLARLVENLCTLTICNSIIQRNAFFSEWFFLVSTIKFYMSVR